MIYSTFRSVVSNPIYAKEKHSYLFPTSSLNKSRCTRGFKMLPQLTGTTIEFLCALFKCWRMLSGFGSMGSEVFQGFRAKVELHGTLPTRSNSPNTCDLSNKSGVYHPV